MSSFFEGVFVGLLAWFLFNVLLVIVVEGFNDE